MTRILTIEDDAVTAREIVAELSSHGLDVDWVDNGREGLVRAVSGDYDLITLDRMLPDIDGFEATQRIVAASQERLRLVDLRYVNGISGYFEVLDAERQAFDSELALSQAVRATHQAVVQLYLALGGGWSRPAG